MAKPPKYIKIEAVPKGCHHSLSVKITIKKWGFPIIIYQCLKENFQLKWYHWLLYPYLCFKLLRREELWR